MAYATQKQVEELAALITLFALETATAIVAASDDWTAYGKLQDISWRATIIAADAVTRQTAADRAEGR